MSRLPTESSLPTSDLAAECLHGNNGTSNGQRASVRNELVVAVERRHLPQPQRAAFVRALLRALSAWVM